RIWQYVPDSTIGPLEIPSQMRGTSGSWTLMGTHSVAAGLAAALNPRVYDADATYFNGPSQVGVKVELVSGGPIQLHSGARVFAGWGGGAVLHASDGNQTGIEFWMFTIFTDGTVGTTPETYAVDVFCPKTNMAVQ